MKNDNGKVIPGMGWSIKLCSKELKGYWNGKNFNSQWHENPKVYYRVNDAMRVAKMLSRKLRESLPKDYQLWVE